MQKTVSVALPEPALHRLSEQNPEVPDYLQKTYW